MSIYKTLEFTVVLAPDSQGVVDPQLLDCHGRKVTLPHILKTLKANGWMLTGGSYSDERLATALGISKRTVQNIIQGRPTTLEVLFRLQSLCESVRKAISAANKQALKREAAHRKGGR